MISMDFYEKKSNWKVGLGGGVKGCINFEIKGGVFGGGAKILYFSPGKSLTLTHGDLSCEWVKIIFFRCGFTFVSLKGWEWDGAKLSKEKTDFCKKKNKYKWAKVPFFVGSCCHSAKCVASILLLGRKIHLFYFSRIPRKTTFAKSVRMSGT